MTKASLYVNSKGYPVTRHSYSGSESFRHCARKYYLERVQGWTEKVVRSSTKFGIALEAAITFYHRNNLDTAAAVNEFVRLWEEHKGVEYLYSKIDRNWDCLNLTGQEMVRLYAIRYPDFPYVVVDPETSFQVQTNVEVFPGTELAGIEFTSFIDLIAKKTDVSGSPVIIDIKTSGKDVPEFTVLDPQLRTYCWIRTLATGKPWRDAAFLHFRKCGRTISKGDTVTLLTPYGGFSAGHDVIVLAQDEFGIWVTSNEKIVTDMDQQFVGQSKKVVELRQSFIQAAGVHVPERHITKQKVQFKAVVITEESAADIGRSIKQDIYRIHQATINDFFPIESGVRFPHDKCNSCAMRGICANQPELRNELLIRKQLDEFDFESDNE